MTDLTDDEYTVLMIAAKGESMMPIGRWAKSVESLITKGLLHRHDKFNNYISNAGRAAIAGREQEDDKALVDVFDKVASTQQTQAKIRDFAEQAAQLLAEAARTSARLTGDTPLVAAARWSTVILNRTREILR